MRAVDEFRSFVATSFEQLSTSVLPWVSAIAYRVNRVFPKDGTEVMLAPLPLQQVLNADLPSASDETGNLLYESDGDKRFLGSDGSSLIDLTKQGTVTSVTGSFPIGISGGTTVTPNVGIAPSSVSTRGAVELATSAETVTGTDPGKAVVPSGLSARLLDPGPIGTGTASNADFTAIDLIMPSQSIRVVSALATHASFDSDVFYGDTDRAANAAFNLIRLDAATSPKFKVSGTGEVTADGGYNSPATDIAEWKLWWDGNPKNEDRTGIAVTFFEGKLRQAYPGDSVVGIISADPAFICGGDIEGVDEQLNGCVGFAGSIPLIRGQEVDERWVKLEDMDDGRELWWVR